MKKSLRYFAVAVAALIGCGYASATSTVLLDADFSKCAAGSEAEPQMFKYSSDFTGLGYTGYRLGSTSTAGQAGGSLYLADGGSVQSPYFSGVSTTGGAIKVTAEVKLRNANIGIVNIKYGYSNTTQIIVETGEWTTVEAIITPTSASSYSNYVTVSPQWLIDGIFVKSIKAEQSTDFLGVPVVYQPSDADGTSFTARWKAVTGATKYLIDVYSYDADHQKVYFVQDKEATGTSCKIEGLNPGTTYCFVVRAANDTAVSGNSEEIEVVKVISSLAAPVVSVTADQTGAFTASWQPVADAESYIAVVSKTETLSAPGETTVLAENFNCFTDGSVSSTNSVFDRHFAMLGEDGWSGSDLCYIDGAIGSWPSSADNPATLVTPALNLADDNGNLAVAVKAAYAEFGTFKTGGTIKFTLIDANEAETEAVTLKIDKIGFNDYTVNLAGGTAESKIKMTFEGTSGQKVFIDDFAVKQVKPAGTKIVSKYAEVEVEACEYAGNVEPKDGVEYTVAVTAAGRTVSGGNIVGIYSEPSKSVVINTAAGVGAITADETDAITIKALGNGIVEISAPAASHVNVYDLTGRHIAAIPVAEGISTVEIDAKGLVIVKAGATAVKIAL